MIPTTRKDCHSGWICNFHLNGMLQIVAFRVWEVRRATDDFAKVLNWTIGSLSAAVKRLKKWLVGTSGGHGEWRDGCAGTLEPNDGR